MNNKPGLEVDGDGSVALEVGSSLEGLLGNLVGSQTEETVELLARSDSKYVCDMI